MYTKDDFKNELLNYISTHPYDPANIGNLAYDLFSEHIREIDSHLREKMLDIANMEMGSEFEMTREELLEFLDNM